MSYKRSKYFLTTNKRKIKYLFLNKKSQITVVFFHGFMSDMVGKKPNTIQKFCTKKKIGFLDCTGNLNTFTFSFLTNLSNTPPLVIIKDLQPCSGRKCAKS